MGVFTLQSVALSSGMYKKQLLGWSLHPLRYQIESIQEGIELVSATHGFKFEAPDGKLRVADVLNSKGGGVLKKVNSGSGKLGYRVTDSVH